MKGMLAGLRGVGALAFVLAIGPLGAGAQELVSARLIMEGTQIIDGVTIYNFDVAIQFWIATSVVSMVLAASLWNTKIRD